MTPQRSAPTRDLRRTWLVGALASSVGGSALVVWSAYTSDTRLGAPPQWAWILTALQVVALWAAGRQHLWAWLLGAAVQPVWIVYAALTGQLGFVPGCLVSAGVQLHNFLTSGDHET